MEATAIHYFSTTAIQDYRNPYITIGLHKYRTTALQTKCRALGKITDLLPGNDVTVVCNILRDHIQES